MLPSRCLFRHARCCSSCWRCALATYTAGGAAPQSGQEASGTGGGHAGALPCAGLEEALKRKDAIIRVRNAQISALWDELHTRQPWTNALAGEGPINLMAAAEAQPANASRKLLVIGINTVRRPSARRQAAGLVF